MVPSRISQLSRDGRLPGDHCEVYDTAAAHFGKYDLAREGEICRSRRFPVCSVGVMSARPASVGFPCDVVHCVARPPLNDIAQSLRESKLTSA